MTCEYVAGTYLENYTAGQSLTSSDCFCLCSGWGRPAKEFKELRKVIRGSWAKEAGGWGRPSILWEGHGDAGGSYWKRDEPAVMRRRTKFPLPKVERDSLKIVGD